MTRRRVSLFVIAFMAIVFLAAGGLVVFRLPLAEILLRRGLAAQGLTSIEFAVAELGLYRARLTGVALGRGRELEVAELRLSYTPDSLLARRVEAVDITGLRMKLDLTGAAPPLGSLQAALTPRDTPADAAPPLALPPVRVSDARIDAATPTGPVTAELSGEVAPQDGGRLRADFDLSLAAALGARVSGRLSAAGDLGGDIAGTLTVHNGRLAMATTEVAGAQGEFNFRLDGFAPRSAEGRLALGRLSLERTEVPGAVLEIAATPTEANLIARASAGDGSFEAEVEAEIANPTGDPRLRATGRVVLDLAAPIAAPLWTRAGIPPPRGGRVALDLRAGAEASQKSPWRLSDGTLDLDLDVTDLAAPGLAVPAARLRLPLGIALRDAELRLRSRGDGAFHVAGATYATAGARWRSLEPLAGAIAALETTWSPGDPEGPSRLAAVLRPEPTALEVARDNAAPLRVELAGQSLDVAYEAGRSDAPPLSLALAEGRLAAPDQALAAEAVTFTAELEPTLALRRARFAVGALRHLGEPAAFAPWSLNGTLRGRGEAIHLDATARGPDGHGTVTASGDLDPGAGNGRLTLSLAPVAFAEGGPAPATFVPALTAIRDARGSVSGTAEMEWGPAEPLARGRLVLDDLAFTAPGAAVAGLELDLTLDRLYPPRTPPDQRLTVARIDPGVPLRDLDLRFRILPGAPPKLAIGSGEVGLLDGGLSLAAVTIDPAAERVAVPVTARGLDLTAFFALIDVEGLAGEGKLSGQIPLVFSGGAVAVEDGHLAAEGPGVLRIRSDTARRLLASGGESTELVLNALEDFRYSELTLDVAKELTGDPRLTLSMLGHNPAVYEGHPIRFNVNLEGRTGRLLESLSEAYSLSNRLLLRLWRTD